MIRPFFKILVLLNFSRNYRQLYSTVNFFWYIWILLIIASVWLNELELESNSYFIGVLKWYNVWISIYDIFIVYFVYFTIKLKRASFNFSHTYRSQMKFRKQNCINAWCKKKCVFWGFQITINFPNRNGLEQIWA